MDYSLATYFTGRDAQTTWLHVAVQEAFPQTSTNRDISQTFASKDRKRA